MKKIKFVIITDSWVYCKIMVSSTLCEKRLLNVVLVSPEHINITYKFPKPVNLYLNTQLNVLWKFRLNSMQYLSSYQLIIYIWLTEYWRKCFFSPSHIYAINIYNVVLKKSYIRIASLFVRCSFLRSYQYRLLCFP